MTEKTEEYLVLRRFALLQAAAVLRATTREDGEGSYTPRAVDMAEGLLVEIERREEKKSLRMESK